MHSGDQILKRDKMGRVRTHRARREELLDEFEGSGVAALNFAQIVGIKYQTFASWMQRRRRERVAAGSLAAGKHVPGVGRALRLVEAVAEPSASQAACQEAGLRVRLGCGAQLEIADEQGALPAEQLLGALSRIGSATPSC